MDKTSYPARTRRPDQGGDRRSLGRGRARIRRRPGAGGEMHDAIDAGKDRRPVGLRPDVAKRPCFRVASRPAPAAYAGTHAMAGAQKLMAHSVADKAACPSDQNVRQSCLRYYLRARAIAHALRDRYGVKRGAMAGKSRPGAALPAR